MQRSVGEEKIVHPPEICERRRCLKTLPNTVVMQFPSMLMQPQLFAAEFRKLSSVDRVS
jgi:hypothetical protein